ncbi:hypothetical protein LTR08_008125 [Meristemomyces frigidus]|nr:hypothetical protein LTR08_008125 [Meristemomyces frigidus]
MGKRKAKARKPTGPKKREPLSTSFKCVFCNNENSVTVSLDKKNGIGTLSCRGCGQNFQSKSMMKGLMQPVDIYYEWIDACDEVAKTEAAASAPTQPNSAYHRPQPASNAGQGLVPGDKYTDEDDGFIDDEDADGEVDFAD